MSKIDLLSANQAFSNLGLVPVSRKSQTFRAHFGGYHNSLCTSEGVSKHKLCNSFIVYRISESQFYEWLFRPEKLSGLSKKKKKRKRHVTIYGHHPTYANHREMSQHYLKISLTSFLVPLCFCYPRCKTCNKRSRIIELHSATTSQALSGGLLLDKVGITSSLLTTRSKVMNTYPLIFDS